MTTDVLHGEGHGHDPALAHHFDTPEQQRESGKLGMWLFLVTEILLFGGLFVAYAVYRSNHPEIFVYAHQYLNKIWGGINTVVLICSSLSMAWAVRAAQLGQRKVLIGTLVATLVFACMFLGIKGIEYHDKWEEGLLWGRNYQPTAEALEKIHDPGVKPGVPAVKLIVPPPADRSQIAPAARGPEGIAKGNPEAHRSKHEIVPRPANVHIFFGIYFIMTGLHGLHVLAGMSAIGWILMRSVRGDFSSRYFIPVDLVGLYWHLVDLIWIFLFPLLYLIH